jgi:hypothetical protein
MSPTTSHDWKPQRSIFKTYIAGCRPATAQRLNRERALSLPSTTVPTRHFGGGESLPSPFAALQELASAEPLPKQLPGPRLLPRH